MFSAHAIGWVGGFSYYILTLIPLVFYNPKISNSQKLLLGILVTGIYLAIKHDANTHIAIIQIENDIVNLLYFMNSLFFIFIIAALTYYCSLASEITENRIQKSFDQKAKTRLILHPNSIHKNKNNSFYSLLPLTITIKYSNILIKSLLFISPIKLFTI